MFKVAMVTVFPMPIYMAVFCPVQSECDDAIMQVKAMRQNLMEQVCGTIMRSGIALNGGLARMAPNNWLHITTVAMVAV